MKLTKIINKRGGMRDLFAYNLGKINETSGPPVPLFQWCQNGAFLLHHAFIIALGEEGYLFHFILWNIVREQHWRNKNLFLLCRSHLICFRTFSDQGKRTLAEQKSNELCARLKRNWNKIMTWFIFGVVYFIDMKTEYA